MNKTVFIFFLLFVSAISNAQIPVGQKLIKNFLADTSLTYSVVSIYAVDMNSGEVLLDSKPQMSITPASVLKLVTTATAFEVLGADYRFTSTLWIDGQLEGNILNGNLVITGGGDPTLGSAYFNTESQKKNFLSYWTELVKQAGINSINGHVVVDPFLYSDQDVPQTWIWEDMGNYYGAAAKGIAIYDNTFRIFFNTGTQVGVNTSVVRTEPFIPGLEIKNEVLAANDNRDRAYVFGNSFDSYRIVKGTLPVGRESFSVRASVPDPALLLANDFYQALEKSGVTIKGSYLVSKVKNADQVVADELIGQWKSPTLSDIAQQLNFESINLFAEHFCKHLGLVISGEGSTKAGTDVIIRFWKDRGIDTRFFFMADGSGLSRANAMSSKTLVDILAYMYQHSYNFTNFKSSIPLTGLNGTQQYYFKQSLLKGKVYSKSGSMTRVRSFAGYMTTSHGTEVAYSIIVNNFNSGGVAMALKLERLIENIYFTF